MKTIVATFLSTLALTVVTWGQQPQPTTPVANQPTDIADVLVSPRVVSTVPIGETATVKFRVLLSNGQSVDDLRTLPIQIATYTLDGVNVTDATTKCNLQTGECFIRSEKPGPLSISLYTGPFGRGTVTMNFLSLRSSFPAVMSIAASQVQAKEGSVVTLTTTSPVSSPGPVQIRATTRFANQNQAAEKYIYLPGGVSYGQQIEINAENVRPLDVRDRRHFQVEMLGLNGSIIANGFGSSVGATEIREFDASVDDNKDLSFVLNSSYNPSAEYTVVLLRGDRFRLELSQFRSELFAYPQGDKTVLLFNKGSLAENTVQLPAGHYSVAIHAHDRSNGINWSHARADALGLNNSFVVH